MRATGSAADLARRLARRRGDDEGFALVVALLVTLISFILVTAVLAQAVHNVTQAGYFRKRTAAIHAAEAGLNWFSHQLESASLRQLSTSPWAYDAGSGWWTRTATEVASDPDDATFTIRVKYTASDVCATAPCTASGLTPLPLVDPIPKTLYAIVRSIGTANGVSRALESAVRLHTQTGGVNSALGVIGTFLCFDDGGELSLLGSIHVLELPSGIPTGFPCTQPGVVVGNGNDLIIDGQMLIDDQGLRVDNGGVFTITENVWAEGAISLGGTGGNIVDECGQNVICVGGDAVGETVTIGSGAVVLGDLVECEPACPPTEATFPRITADSSMWTNWSLANVASGSAALTAIQSATTQTAFFITSSTSPGCDTIFAGDYTVNADVAIVSSCRFEINGNLQARIAGTGSITLISAWPGTAASPGSAPTCNGSRDINVSQNPTVGPAIFLYTPCRLLLENNQSPLRGQFVARFMQIRQRVNLEVINLLGEGAQVPGLASGFKQDIRYVKEILPDLATGA